METSLAVSASAHGPDATGESVAAALDALAGEPGLVLAFPSGVDAARAAWQLADAAGPAPAAGMTGSGSFASDGLHEGACTAIAFGRSVHAAIELVTGIGGRVEQATGEAARAALARVDPQLGSAVLAVLIDPLSGDQADAVRAAYEACGSAIPLIGGGAGGDRPLLLANRVAHTDAVLAIAIVNSGPVGLGVAHGCTPVAVPSIATRSAGTSVLELDGRPAAEVYLEKLGVYHALSDAEFTAISVRHPIGQPELTGQSRLRHVFGRTADGGLRCATVIPRNAAVEFAAQDMAGVSESAGRAVGLALGQLGPHPARAALVFDCASRKLTAGERADEAVRSTLKGFGELPPPLAGCFTHGEIGRGRGAKGDRNHAIVVCAFG